VAHCPARQQGPAALLRAPLPCKYTWQQHEDTQKPDSLFIQTAQTWQDLLHVRLHQLIGYSNFWYVIGAFMYQYHMHAFICSCRAVQRSQAAFDTSAHESGTIQLAWLGLQAEQADTTIS
jgi:hypothetical protein